MIIEHTYEKLGLGLCCIKCPQTRCPKEMSEICGIGYALFVDIKSLM